MEHQSASAPIHHDPFADAAAEALSRAVGVVGTRAELARRLGVSRAAVTQWRRVPTKRAYAVSQITGVPMHQLCPELAAPACAAGASS